MAPAKRRRSVLKWVRAWSKHQFLMALALIALAAMFTEARRSDARFEGDQWRLKEIEERRSGSQNRYQHILLEAWASAADKARSKEVRNRYFTLGLLTFGWMLAWVWIGGRPKRIDSPLDTVSQSDGQGSEAHALPEHPNFNGERFPIGGLPAETSQVKRAEEHEAVVPPSQSTTDVASNVNDTQASAEAAGGPHGAEPIGLAPITKIKIAFWTAVVLGLAAIAIRLAVPAEGSNPLLAHADPAIMLVLAGLMLWYKSRAAAVALFIMYLASKAVLIGSLIYGAVQLGTFSDLAGFFARRIIFTVGMAALLWLGIDGTFALRRASRQE